MSCKGLHCPGCGDGGGGVLVALVAIVIIGAIIARPVEHAAIDVLHFLEVAAIITGCVAGAAALGAAGYLAVRGHRRALSASARPAPVIGQARAAAPVTDRTRPPAAIPAPQELHLHLHGVTAEDVAAIVARRQAIEDK